MTGRFGGRAALVTGAASGIGAATARRLSHEGAAIALVDLDATGAEVVATEIRVAGGEARSFACDVADSASVASTVAFLVMRKLRHAA